MTPSPEYIASYLTHPVREPDYRKGRSHVEFMTTPEALGINLTLSNLIIHLERILHPILKGYACKDYIKADESLVNKTI